MTSSAGWFRYAQGPIAVGSVQYQFHDTNDRAWLVSQLVGLTTWGWAVRVDPENPKMMETQTVTIDADIPSDAMTGILHGLMHCEEFDLPDPIST